jgi:hypothetical protein
MNMTIQFKFIDFHAHKSYNEEILFWTSSCVKYDN